MLLFPNCKINLGLQVRRKRADGFHDLETVFYPVPVTDALELVQAEGRGTIEFTSSGTAVTVAADQNICVKAYRMLQERIPGLPSVKMHLHKVIPSGAGLGGGSSDGAFALSALNRKLNLGITPETLAELALALGSDCPFFLHNKPVFAEGRGERFSPLSLSLAGYQLILVHPGIHVSTSDAFRGIFPNDDRPSLRSLIGQPVDSWHDCLHNDFEQSVFSQHPDIASIKDQLYANGAIYAAMSGSGSSVFGLFEPGKPAGATAFPDYYFERSVTLS